MGCATLTPLKVVARSVRAARALGAVTRGARIATGATMAAMVACDGVFRVVKRSSLLFVCRGDFLAGQSSKRRIPLSNQSTVASPKFRHWIRSRRIMRQTKQISHE